MTTVELSGENWLNLNLLKCWALAFVTYWKPVSVEWRYKGHFRAWLTPYFVCFWGLRYPFLLTTDGFFSNRQFYHFCQSWLDYQDLSIDSNSLVKTLRQTVHPTNNQISIPDHENISHKNKNYERALKQAGAINIAFKWK